MEKDLQTSNTNNIKNEIVVILTTNLPEEYHITNNRIPVPANYVSEKLKKLVIKFLKLK